MATHTSGFRSAMVIAGALTLCATLSSAQPLDKRSTFHFTSPVALPGVTLPPGGYLFRVADSAGRDVVQVLSADGRQPYAMFFALRRWRSEAASVPEARFMETASEMPLAVESWWYPGETLGYEFVYPREQALLLAKGTGQRVLTGGLAGIAEDEVRWISPDGVEFELDDHEGGALFDQAAPFVTGAVPLWVQANDTAPPVQLPATGGAAGAWLLVALTAGSGWAALRVLRRRAAR